MLQFSAYRSFASLGRLIPKYFILFDAIVNGIDFLISISDCLLLVCSNTIDFCTLILYHATLLKSFLNSSKCFVDSFSTSRNLRITAVFCVFLTSLLEYNCFTMVCQFLLYNKVNQLYIYICPHISSILHLPPSHPPYTTPLGGHKAPS